MEIECEETAVESPSITSCETLYRNDETVENDAESETSEINQVQSNLFVPPEDLCDPKNTETCLESNVTSNKADFLTSL